MAKTDILAVHSGALGDCVLFGHLLWRLGGQATLVAGGQVGRLLAGCGVAARAMDFDVLPMHEIFADASLERCSLPGLLGRCDRLISCFATGNRKAERRLAAMCACRGAAFLPTRPNASEGGHLFDVWGDMLGLPAGRAAGFQAWPIRAEWRRQAGAALQRAGADPAGGYFVIHPGAGAADKCWPLDRFVELAGRVGKVAFVVGPVEADRWLAERIRDLGRRFPVIACPQLELLAGLLAGARGFAGNDSGVAHLAAAVGVATLVLFGPTRPEHFAPLGTAVKALRAEPIEGITIDQAFAALSQLAAGGS